MPSITAILFDADGVLQHASADLAARLASVLGLVPERVDDFVQDVFSAEEPALTGSQDFVNALRPVVEKWGAPGTAADVARCWCSIDVERPILEIISELRASGYVCALATNQQSYRAAHMDGPLGYDHVFDHSFYSCHLGFAKPDRRYFEAILESLRFAPSDILFLDDKERNVSAAAAAGLHAERFVHSRHPDAAAALRALLRGFSVS